MADLEELGFLDQPHTSAGRTPSDKAAYRLYVDRLMHIDRDHEGRGNLLSGTHFLTRGWARSGVRVLESCREGAFG